MPDVVKHAWTHRPKALGGTDPIELEGGDLPWIRLKLLESSLTNEPDDDPPAIPFDTVVNGYTDVFDTTNVGGTDNAVVILQDGLYSVLYRLYLDSFPDEHFATQLNGIDWDEWAYYEKAHFGGVITGTGVHDSLVFRSGPDFGLGLPRPKIFVSTFNPAGASGDLVVSGDGGTYMEIVQLSARITINGVDSNSPGPDTEHSG